jgi:hypothetical protein
MKFPFSLIAPDGNWEKWESIYFPYIEMIEKKIIKTNPKNSKLYRNYDFALKSDIFQRVIDLLVVSKKEAKLEDKEEVDLYDYQFTFVYCHRSSKPFRYINLLKFVNEIKAFSKKFKKDKINNCHDIRSELILISQHGYEQEIKNYLRNHLIGETDYIIPLISIPPINNEVWHNFIEYQPKPEKRNELENIIKIGNRNSSPSYKNNMVKSAKSEYDQIIQREKMAKIDNRFLNKWYEILNVSESNKILSY